MTARSFSTLPPTWCFEWIERPSILPERYLMTHFRYACSHLLNWNIKFAFCEENQARSYILHFLLLLGTFWFSCLCCLNWTKPFLFYCLLPTSIPGTVLDSTSSMVVCLTEWGAVCKITFDSRVEIRWKVYPTGRSLSMYSIFTLFYPLPLCKHLVCTSVTPSVDIYFRGSFS